MEKLKVLQRESGTAGSMELNLANWKVVLTESWKEDCLAFSKVATTATQLETLLVKK